MGTGAIVFKNYMDFTDLKDYVYLKWEAVQDGIIIEESIQKELPSVLPSYVRYGVLYREAPLKMEAAFESEISVKISGSRT